MRKACVYRVFDEDGALLYVGSTYSFELRKRSHQDKNWYDRAVKWDVDWYPSRQQATDAEYLTIHNENPVYNRLRVVGGKLSMVDAPSAQSETGTIAMTFRVSPEQRAQMLTAANAKGLPLTTWIRMVALEAAKKGGE